MADRPKRKRILLVEDNPDLHILVKHYLRDAYDVDAAYGPDEARRRAETTSYDLFLIDIQLHGAVSGVELLHQLRDHPAHAQTPALAFTALDDMGNMVRFLDVGFDGYLKKPCRRQMMLSTVAAVLSAAPAAGPDAEAQEQPARSLWRGLLIAFQQEQLRQSPNLSSLSLYL